MADLYTEQERKEQFRVVDEEERRKNPERTPGIWSDAHRQFMLAQLGDFPPQEDPRQEEYEYNEEMDRLYMTEAERLGER